MRLLFISHSAGLLGAERSLLDICRGALEEGHQIFVLLPRWGPLAEKLLALGAVVNVTPLHAWMGPWHFLPPIGVVRLAQAIRDLPAVRRIIEQVKPTMVITNTAIIPVGAIASGSLGIPHVWIIRESVASNPQLRSIIPKRLLARYVVRNSVVVCGVSHYVAGQFARLSSEDPEHFRVVPPNPIHPNPPPQRQRKQGELRAIMPSYMSREKGQHLAVLAAHLARKRRGTQIAIVLQGEGGGFYSGLLRSLVKMLRLEGTVDFKAWSAELFDIYEGSDVLLMLS